MPIQHSALIPESPGWSLPVSLLCAGFVVVSAGRAAFCLDLYSFGLASASFAVFFGFVNFVLVSAALAAICLVLYG